MAATTSLVAVAAVWTISPTPNPVTKATPTRHPNPAIAQPALNLPPERGHRLLDECGTSDGGVFTPPTMPSCEPAGPMTDLEAECKSAGSASPDLIVGPADLWTASGYWILAANGGVDPFGPGGLSQGSASDIRLTHPVVAMAGTPDGGELLAGRGSDGEHLHLRQCLLLRIHRRASRLSQPRSSPSPLPPTGTAIGYLGLGRERSSTSVMRRSASTAPPAGHPTRRPMPSGMAASNAYGTGYWILDQEGHVVGEAPFLFSTAPAPPPTPRPAPHQPSASPVSPGRTYAVALPRRAGSTPPHQAT